MTQKPRHNWTVINGDGAKTDSTAPALKICNGGQAVDLRRVFSRAQSFNPQAFAASLDDIPGDPGDTPAHKLLTAMRVQAIPADVLRRVLPQLLATGFDFAAPNAAGEGAAEQAMREMPLQEADALLSALIFEKVPIGGALGAFRVRAENDAPIHRAIKAAFADTASSRNDQIAALRNDLIARKKAGINIVEPDMHGVPPDLWAVRSLRLWQAENVVGIFSEMRSATTEALILLNARHSATRRLANILDENCALIFPSLVKAFPALLRDGADPSALMFPYRRNAAHMTCFAIEHAAKRDWESAIKAADQILPWMMRAGVNFEAEDEFGRTPFEIFQRIKKPAKEGEKDDLFKRRARRPTRTPEYPKNS